MYKDNRGVPHIRGKYDHWRSQGAWQTEADFSDGTLRLMGLLWALLDGTGPLILEEPELSLHAEVASHIPEMMDQMQTFLLLAHMSLHLAPHAYISDRP